MNIFMPKPVSFFTHSGHSPSFFVKLIDNVVSLMKEDCLEITRFICFLDLHDHTDQLINSSIHLFYCKDEVMITV